ncbi:MAG: flagellar hook-length control protein FliK [Rhodospirillales bacterium]
MANLAIEQKLNEHGHAGGAQPAAAPNYVNLGGFAVSFGDLLQRVGARLDQAFSVADKSGGIPEAAKSTQSNADSRDYADAREASGGDDRRRDDGAAERGRSTASDARDNGTARADDAPRSDKGTDNAAERDGNNDRDAQGAGEKSEKADNGGNDKTKDDGANETAADGNNDDKGGEKSADTGDGKAAADGKGSQSAVETAANATQAAAVYAAGLIKGKGQQNPNAGKADPQAQAQKGADITDNAALQAAAGKTAKNGQGDHKLGQSNPQAQVKTAGAEQKAQGAELKTQNTSTQNQAQQLARAIGSDSRANFNVNVTKEQAPITSKPTFTVANASVLTADGAAAKNNAQQGQTGQQQGQNPNLTQQAQLAAQQQAQAAQQANVQNAQQGVQPGTGQGGTTTTSAVQTSGGGAQHAGGGESLNNTTQTANTGQQTQQTQQTRESQPQQQAQQAQRTNLPGSAVTEQISIKITKALQTGIDRISIQLKPAELGRVDVKLEMTHDGRVMTVVTAEKQDTLDMLRRDSSELQKALADAGLESGDMEFNLKGQEQQNAEAEGDGTPDSGNADAEAAEEGETDVNDGVMSAWESGIFVNGRLDMRA